jgi:hypothetical protein
LSATSAASIDLVRRSSAFCPVLDPVDRALDAVLRVVRALEAVLRADRALEPVLRADRAFEPELRAERAVLLPVVLLVATCILLSCVPGVPGALSPP